MSSTDSELLRLRLRCDSLAPSAARDAVKGLEAIAPVRDDAMLLVSELVSSAVVDARPQARETIELVATEVPRGVQFAVAGGVSQPKAMVGWVVGAISRRWGIDQSAEGAQLWAELAV
jgi:hypothetical protein